MHPWPTASREQTSPEPRSPCWPTAVSTRSPCVGSQPSALYWHFDNKQQLLAAVADLVVAPVEPTNARKWQNRILGLGSRLRDELLRYPDGAELVATAIAFRLGADRPHQLFADELTRAGMTDDDAGVGASVLVHFVVGYTTDEQQHHQAAALGAIDRVDATQGRFEQGLRLIVAGIEAQLGTPLRP
jgi:TetR/AcrR family transcriptional regulator, tetracycline repressor protein